MIKIAIVGSREKYWKPEQRREVVKLIKSALFKHMSSFYGRHEMIQDTTSITLISGGCPYGGVDVWAEVVADLYDIKKEIFYPEQNRSESFFDRNIKIARECEIIYCFQPEQKPRGGGTWTLEQAEIIGKETHLVIIGDKPDASD